MSTTATTSTIISAPGKVLVAGGYLALDRLYSILVVATSSRFYTVIRPSPPASGSSGARTPIINVRAGQFPADGSVWSFSVVLDQPAPNSDSGNVSNPCLVVEPIGEANNKFVRITLECGLRYVQARLRAQLGQEKGDEELLARLSGTGSRSGSESESESAIGLDIVVLADNDFYSQRETASPVPSQVCPIGAHSSAWLDGPTPANIITVPVTALFTPPSAHTTYQQDRSRIIRCLGYFPHRGSPLTPRHCQYSTATRIYTGILTKRRRQYQKRNIFGKGNEF